MSSARPVFAIVGVGGVGGYFGGCLARAGYDVRFLARGPHLDAIRRDGLSVTTPDGTFRVEVRASDDPAALAPADVVFLCVKLWDTEAAAGSCRPLLGAETAVISLQNGIFAEGLLADVLGRERVMGGLAEVSASITAPGQITKIGPAQRIRFGELDGTPSPRAQRLAEHLSTPGMEGALEADIRTALWTKFIFLTGLSALTALTRRPIGDVRATPETRQLLQAVVGEAYAVGVASGVPLDGGLIASSMARLDALPGEIRASMAVDLAAGRRLELPWLSGAVVDLGARHGIPTPANAFVVAALKLHADGA